MTERQELQLTERVGQRTLVAILGVLTAVVFVGGILAVVADDDPLPAAGARVRLDGIGSLLRADGTDDELRDGAVLHPGDQVELEDGSAVLELAGGGTIEVRSGRGDVDDTRLEVGSPSQLLAGDALAQGPAGMAVEAAGTLVTLRGPDGAAAKIRRELAVTTATYRGDVDVDSAGRTREVPAYRQLSVASVGRTPEAADPFDVDPSDPWDRRYFGAVIALTSSLDSLSQTFTAQGAPRSSADDFEAVLPDLAEQPEFDSSFLSPDRPAGETLVGAAIAVLGTEGSFADRWAAVFDFRDEQADWGLVAFDQGVGEPVLGEVEAALQRSVELPTGEVAAPVVPTTPTTTGGGTTPTSPTTSPTPTPTSAPPTTPTTAPPTTPPVTTPPVTVPPIGPLPEQPLPETGNDVLDGLLDSVGDLLGGLLGGG